MHSNKDLHAAAKTQGSQINIKNVTPVKSKLNVYIISVTITTPLYIVQCQFKCEHKSI